MSVKIDLELQAGDAVTEITAVTGALETMDEVTDDIDFDLGDIDVDEITGKIGDMVDQLNNLDFDLSPLEEKLDRIEALDGTTIDMNLGTPDGDTGSGDSTGGDPPSNLVQNLTKLGGEKSPDGGSPGLGLNEQQLAQKIERVGGFDRGSVSILGDFDAEELNQLAADIENTTKGLTSEKYPWIDGQGDGNLGENQVPGNFHDQPDPSEMDWNELQRRAGEAGVYTQNADRDTLESRIRSQQFSRRGINVETDSHGTVGLRQARRIQSGAYDFPGDSDGVEVPSFSGSHFPGVGDNAGRDLGSDLRASLGKGDKPDMDMGEIGDGFNVRRTADKFKNNFDKVESKLSGLKPTMGKYMQLLAAVLPVALALGTQLLGVAAAMGSVAAAGGALIGLGLLGHGESMAGSFAQAKEQMAGLKREMFETFQPTMQQFAPIQARAFDAIPDAMGGIAETMEGLQRYEGTLFNLGGALAGGFEEAIAIIVQNEKAISQLSTRFGGLIGSGLLQFFDWLIRSASQNQQLLVKMGGDMLMMAGAAYNLAMAVTKIVSTFSPMFEIILAISRLLNNDFIAGMASAIGWIYAVTKAGYAMFSMMQALQAASLSLSSVLMRTGVGALLVGGGYLASQLMMPDTGMTDVSGGSGGGQTVYNDNRSFEINNGGSGDDYALQKSMEDTVYEVAETESAQTPPPIN